ncbi:MAG: hypothetical protein RBS39_07675 [Phycisphaerales bacterium]|nr:hypothetical protein [Phycisphaerales bacterium]
MPIRRTSRARFACSACACCAAALVLSACRSGPKPVTLGAFEAPSRSPRTPVEFLDRAPDDFELSATIYAPGASAEQLAAAPRALRPARYILQVGGVLRASVGPGSTETTFPPVTRRIEPEQVQQLWRFVRDSGLLDPDHPDSLDPAPEYDVLFGRTVAILTIARAGERHTFALALDRPAFDKGAGRTLVDRLAQLAWIPE